MINPSNPFALGDLLSITVTTDQIIAVLINANPLQSGLTTQPKMMLATKSNRPK
jgi:hypothetical protein